jgi:hypothetical protein
VRGEGPGLAFGLGVGFLTALQRLSNGSPTALQRLYQVIQFGYITLFASAFPLAAALSVVCNLVEARR